MDRFLPYSRQHIDQDDIKAVVDVLESKLITQGPQIEKFEAALANYVGAKYAVACATGTAALHLCCLALGLGAGSKVLTSPLTFLASANCAQYVGAETLFCDIDDSLCLSVPLLEELLKQQQVDAVIPVHFAGHSTDMAALNELREIFGFYVIEDAAHALGGEYADCRVGSCEYSDLAVFSFHPVKHMTTGEGGAITTNDEELYKRLKLFRTHGMSKEADRFVNTSIAYDSDGQPNSWYYEMKEPGFNYRITDLQCALGLSQLSKLDKFVARRREIAMQYEDSFRDVETIIIPTEAENAKHAYHLYALQFEFDKLGLSRNQMMDTLRKANIGTQVMYIPVHLQPYYRSKYGHTFGDYPISEKYYERCLSIPIFPGMDEKEVDYVVTNIIELVGR